MSDRPRPDKPVRDRKQPTSTGGRDDSAPEMVGVYDRDAEEDNTRKTTPESRTPDSVGVYDRPAKADRRISPIILAVIILVVLALLAFLALTLLF